VVVNVNPLYTRHETEHQLRDSGAQAIVVLANFAHHLERLDLDHVIVTELGDLFPAVKRTIVNAVVKHIKKMVPTYRLPKSIAFRSAMARGARHGRFESAALCADDLAFLQYTGGTTGVAKGAMLTHGNIVANVLQCTHWLTPALAEGREVLLTPLPLYHIFSLTVNCIMFMRYGAENVLVTNPRDLPAFVKLLASRKFTVMTAVNTLLRALMDQPGFSQLDLSSLKYTVAGAMALQTDVAERWKKTTKSTVLEGYGLTECSPVVCCNPVDGTDRVGSIGLPFPSTEVRLLDDDGNEVELGSPGELCVKGPQVMKGYWNQQEETERVLRNGWLHTGDVAVMAPDGFLKIVDRKKDMILVSGFNVYPNEVEDVAVQHPDIVEAGVVGVPDERSGEAVKLVCVRRHPTVSEADVIEFCRKQLTGYKVPKHVEFRESLPKTNVGKVLRKDLR
jgi:long-chain acyl-CoA synthetase